MKLTLENPPRAFTVKGATIEVVLYDCGDIALNPDEQVTFRTDTGGEYDVTRKSWGFYATPSTNQRLKNFGLRTALVRASTGRWYVMLVQPGGEADFARYIESDKQTVVCWLDDEDHLSRLKAAFES
jgi:hypothetical protein